MFSVVESGDRSESQGRKRERRLQDGGDAEKEGLGGQRLRAAGLFCSSPASEESPRAGRRVSAAPVRGLGPEGPLQTGRIRGTAPAAGFCWGERRGKYIWTCMGAYTCVGVGRAHVHICVQGLGVHMCIYVCRGWACTCAYMCAGVGRAHVYICV